MSNLAISTPSTTYIHGGLSQVHTRAFVLDDLRVVRAENGAHASNMERQWTIVGGLV